MARELVPNNPLAERLQLVLQGRPLSTWSKRVGLSSGTASRLWAGSAPDPLKLIPAIRIENLSLSWLLDGIGAPFIVQTVLSDSHAAAVIDERLREDAQAQVLVVQQRRSFTPIIYSPVTEATVAGFGYRYHRVQIIGGDVCQHQCRDLLARYAAQFNQKGRVRISRFRGYDTFQQPLSLGNVGNYSIFGDEEKSSLVDASEPLNWPLEAEPDFSGSQVNDVRLYTMSPAQIELQDAFSQLVGEDQGTAIRILRGLAAVSRSAR